jgi:tripartite-type tricarboxylate transporter receptor subunit TctC
MRVGSVAVKVALIALIAPCTGLVAGQNYPEKPIRVLTTTTGGPNDLASRLIADGVASSLGQRMIIENRAIIGVEITAKAPPDGYTLLHYTNVLWLMPLFRDGVTWDPVTDFAPITLTMRQPGIVVVHPSLPARSIKDLIALAKARPGELNYASSSTGALNHVAAELFKAMAGINLVRINYKGGGPAVNDLVAGQVQVMFGSAGVVAPHTRTGRLRALAVTSAEPTVLVPGLPTVAAAGLPGYESSQLTGMFAPAKTPAAIINRLNQEITRVLQRPATQERFLAYGMDAVPCSPVEFVATIKSEMARMDKVIKDANLRE